MINPIQIISIGADFDDIEGHERHNDIETKGQPELGQCDEKNTLAPVAGGEDTVQKREGGSFRIVHKRNP